MLIDCMQLNHVLCQIKLDCCNVYFVARLG